MNMRTTINYDRPGPDTIRTEDCPSARIAVHSRAGGNCNKSGIEYETIVIEIPIVNESNRQYLYLLPEASSMQQMQ